MSINQAIYTSSASGISKGGGLGVHSYNRACSEAEINEFGLSYCHYYFHGNAEEIPDLPVKLVYGRTSNGRYMQSCITYLGKDYNQESGRMGNLLSHMYSFGKEDLHVYPLQLYGSPDYRTSMRTDEVDGSTAVDYLPEVSDVACGTEITIDNIQEFIGDGRMEMFCHLLAAVLKIDNIHKIIIYDTHENIIWWLAAIQFALPLQCAREISYSSYERDPMMSEFDIRGAVVGMCEGDCYEYAASGQFYVFDGVNKEYPKFDVSSDFFKYGVETGMDFLYDVMTEFFAFVQRYNYEKADDDIKDGFALYQMIQGGMNLVEDAEFTAAVSFEAKYGNKESYKKLLTELFEKLTDNPGGASETLLHNIRVLLIGYLRMQLDEKELTFILSLVIQFEEFILQNKYEDAKVDEMWCQLYVNMHKYQKSNIANINKFLVGAKRYERLGAFCAYLYDKAEQNRDVHMAGYIFTKYWGEVPEKEYVHFDPVVDVAAVILNAYEKENEKYEDAIDLFLWVQEKGKGNIGGNGCDRLIRIIENLTDITDKKLFKEKKKGDTEFDRQFEKCAFEAFNYTQRHGRSLGIAKIRLYHLAKCLVDICSEEKELTKSNKLKIYAKCPIQTKTITDEVFDTYIDRMSDYVNQSEVNEEEYQLLFSFMELDDERKETLSGLFLDHESDYFKREKEISGITAVLNTVKLLGDEAYELGVVSCIADMKDSYKDKVSSALKADDREAYSYWIRLVTKAAKKVTKKGFFRFGKR